MFLMITQVGYRQSPNKALKQTRTYYASISKRKFTIYLDSLNNQSYSLGGLSELLEMIYGLRLSKFRGTRRILKK